MADTPISLSKFRKAKARAEKRARGEANAVKFGRSKTEKTRDKTIQEREISRLEAHRREDDHDR
ncbi:MAG: DUF4169 family protein [Mangrovicoccus sp.]|nr:DUF4169 family protein [Mangrovicoccus sp.]